MKLVVGLGNPGLRYKNTRHNAGFLVVKEIAGRLGARPAKRKYGGRLARCSAGGKKVILFTPETYMNLSGEAVREAAKSERIDAESLIVICDDADMPLGSLRLRQSGSSGGHKGLKSVINSLGTDAFPRLKVGIAGKEKRADLAEFVLEPFDSQEKSALKEIINRAADCVLTWLERGAGEAMSKFNRKKPDRERPCSTGDQ